MSTHFRNWPALAFAVATAFSLAMAGAPQVTCRLDENPAVGQGLEFQFKNSESQNEMVQRAGRKACREKKMMYFKVTDGAMQNGKTPLVFLEIEYFDEGQGVVALKYDSSDKNVGSADKPGVWKSRRAMMLTDSGTWKVTKFSIPDAFFAGRCNGGDFRLEGKAGMTISRITLVAGDEKSQAANVEFMKNAPALPKTEAFTLSLADVWAGAKLFREQPGLVKKGVDTSTLTWKVMAGYQGWHGAPGDGSGLGWVHWAERGTFEPGDCHVDYWPDMGEAGADEKVPTAFRKSDGSVAYVYTAMNRNTVNRHFKWMEDYGIDGVFLQRFATGLKNPGRTFKNNTTLEHVRAGANAHGRTWAVMYDLSGAKDTQALLDDWKNLVGKLGVGKDPAYQHHKGKPVLAIWGLFASRDYCFEAFEKLMDLAQNDPVYGGFSIKLGTENNWRTGDGPGYERVRAIIEKADIISPWAVGRYGNLEGAEIFINLVQRPDVAWCRAHRKDYMPVIFPGFSSHNMNDGTKPIDKIPRLEGRFFWRQAVANKEAGADMLYVGMFDEVDEGTAIFKIDNNPPVCPGETTRFLTYPGLPPDHYLWLAGQSRLLLSGQVAPSALPPPRPGVPVVYRPLFTNGLSADAKTLRANLGLSPQWQGLFGNQKGVEFVCEPVVAKGRGGWLVKTPANSPGARKFYLVVEHEAFRGMKTPSVTLEVDVYSEAPLSLKVVYDSRDFSLDARGTAPGTWKVAGGFDVSPGAWVTQKFVIDDGLFVGRLNGGDFRLEGSPGVDWVLGGARLTRRD